MNEMAEGHPNYEHKTEINEQENAIQILKETAEKFRLLYAEARLALAGKDVEEYKTKLKERAQLLVDLPNRLAPALENMEMEVEIQQEILRKVTSFAVMAEEMLTENVLGLCVLLTRKGQKREEKDDLEKLVEHVEEKRV